MSDDPIPRFDVIKNSDFEPAIKQGIAEEDEDIRNITSCISRPTFANTIEKLDSAGELLERVTDVFYNLLNAASDEEKEQLAEKFTPILAAHQNNIMLNQDLFLRVKYVYTHPLKSLSPEKLRLTEKIYRSFRRSGAMLKGEDRKQFRKLTEEASKLTLQFQTNLLHARKKFSLNIIGKDMLDGVPETVLDTAAATARENGENGWTITLDEPVYMPVLTYCNNRELRRALYMAYHGVCLRKGEDCNTEICKDIVNVRQKMAQLLGYKSFADYVLEERMAGSKNNVYRMFSDLLEHYSDPARKEVSQVERYAKSMEGEDFELQPWDFAYYSHKLKLSLFDIDSEMLRPYFELSKVKEGIFNLATELYGIRFSINPDIPVYAGGVTAYDVVDKNKTLLGVLFLDLHPRKGKQGGAWMTTYSPQYISEKKNHRPCVAIVTNFTPHPAHAAAPLAAHARRSNHIPARVRARIARANGKHGLPLAERHKRFVGFCGTALTNYGKLCRREKILEYICTTLPDGRTSARRTYRQDCAQPQFQRSLQHNAAGFLRPARYGVLYARRTARR